MEGERARNAARRTRRGDRWQGPARWASVPALRTSPVSICWS